MSVQDIGSRSGVIMAERGLIKTFASLQTEFLRSLKAPSPISLLLDSKSTPRIYKHADSVVGRLFPRSAYTLHPCEDEGQVRNWPSLFSGWELRGAVRV